MKCQRDVRRKLYMSDPTFHRARVVEAACTEGDLVTRRFDIALELALSGQCTLTLDTGGIRIVNPDTVEIKEPHRAPTVSRFDLACDRKPPAPQPDNTVNQYIKWGDLRNANEPPNHAGEITVAMGGIIQEPLRRRQSPGLDPADMGILQPWATTEDMTHAFDAIQSETRGGRVSQVICTVCGGSLENPCEHLRGLAQETATWSIRDVSAPEPKDGYTGDEGSDPNKGNEPWRRNRRRGPWDGRRRRK